MWGLGRDCLNGIHEIHLFPKVRNVKRTKEMRLSLMRIERCCKKIVINIKKSLYHNSNIFYFFILFYSILCYLSTAKLMKREDVDDQFFGSHFQSIQINSFKNDL